MERLTNTKLWIEIRLQFKNIRLSGLKFLYFDILVLVRIINDT